MSVRQIFGFLMPGFAWVLVLYWRFVEQFPALDIHPLFQDKALLYAAILSLSYLFGALNIQVAFRLLAITGELADRFVKHTQGTRWEPAFSFLSTRIHIFNLGPLDDETRLHFPVPLPSEAKDEYGSSYWSCKMYVLANSPALAKVVLESEGDINFSAGMVFPLLFFGLFLLPRYTPAALLAILAAIFLALRFQHLRHDDIALVVQAYQTLREGDKSVLHESQ